MAPARDSHPPPIARLKKFRPVYPGKRFVMGQPQSYLGMNRYLLFIKEKLQNATPLVETVIVKGPTRTSP
jgi:hypothetical protein